MTVQFTISRLVEFSDTDMAGIVHFTNFYRYMEEGATYDDASHTRHGLQAWLEEAVGEIAYLKTRSRRRVEREPHYRAGVYIVLGNPRLLGVIRQPTSNARDTIAIPASPPVGKHTRPSSLIGAPGSRP